MAKIRRPTPKNVTPISDTPPIEPADSPESADGQQISAPATERPPAPPVAAPAKPEPPKIPTFFETMGKIRKEDWGPRASVYLYRVEPWTDRLRTSDKKYIQSYDEPINEERILVDHGSGKYKAVLSFRKPNSGNSNTEIDSHYFDILNLKYPPKIPPGDWIDDPKNKKWAWARVPDAAAQQAASASGLGQMLDAVKVINEIRTGVREEMEPAPAAVVAPVAVQPVAVDPWAAAEKILKMRSDNPMVAILMQRMEAMDRSAEEARKREFELQKELRQRSQQPQSNGMSTVKELINSFKELLPDIKQLIPGLGENAAPAATGRGSRMNAWEFFQPAFTEIAKGIGPAIPFLAQAMMTPRTQPDAQPALLAPGPALPNPPQQPAAPASIADQKLLNLARAIAPGVMKKLALDGPADELGAEFAVSVADMLTSDDFKALQAGSDKIVLLFKQSPYWAMIGDEARFVAFVKGFCAWKPEAEEEPPADPGVIDLDTETEEAHVS